jgi:hypothetical protein
MSSTTEHGSSSTDESKRSPTDDFVRLVCELSDADMRSVLRRMLGMPVRGRAQARIDHALHELRWRGV